MMAVHGGWHGLEDLGEGNRFGGSRGIVDSDGRHWPKQGRDHNTRAGHRHGGNYREHGTDDWSHSDAFHEYHHTDNVADGHCRAAHLCQWPGGVRGWNCPY
jgi:hypothetical protein